METDEKIIDVVARLRKLRAADQPGITAPLRRFIEDPLRPRSAAGILRVNPLVVTLASLTVLALGTFLLFGLLQL